MAFSWMRRVDYSGLEGCLLRFLQAYASGIRELLLQRLYTSALSGMSRHQPEADAWLNQNLLRRLGSARRGTPYFLRGLAPE
jgi:hypothetical protein